MPMHMHMHICTCTKYIHTEEYKEVRVHSWKDGWMDGSTNAKVDVVVVQCIGIGVWHWH